MIARKLGLAVVLLSVGCGTFTDPKEAPAPPSGQPGDKAPPAPPLDSPPDANEITEAFGIFVTPNGSAEGEGTRESPFNAIAPALAKAKAASKRVYVCAGTFKEAVTVASGIPLVGGLDCSTPTWKMGSVRSRIEAPTSPALRAENIDDPTRIQGFDFVSADGTPGAPTSIGFVAKKAGKLTVANSTISAGKGHDGAAGAEGVQLTFAVTDAPDSRDEWIDGDLNPTGGVVRRRGAGGGGTCSGAPGFVVPPGAEGGLGGGYYSYVCNGGVCEFTGDPFEWYIKSNQTPEAGRPGNGAAAVAGRDGLSASHAGTMSNDTFVPADGTTGTNGTVGKSGAGGGGGMPSRIPQREHLNAIGPSGPGGGAGGCPGLAGTAGKGGGASIGALLTDSADLVFEISEVIAGQGGAGGKGSFGSTARRGGPPASARPRATAGEQGEAGGRAGTSGNGAGGSSFGIAYTRGAPQVTNSIVRAGAPGAGIVAETRVDDLTVAKTIPASVAGEAKDLISF